MTTETMIQINSSKHLECNPSLGGMMRAAFDPVNIPCNYAGEYTIVETWDFALIVRQELVAVEGDEVAFENLPTAQAWLLAQAVGGAKEHGIEAESFHHNAMTGGATVVFPDRIFSVIPRTHL